MKKVISLCLAALMLMTVLPFSALAANANMSERDQLIALACDTFPEYASKIRGEGLSIDSVLRSTQSRELVIEETRSLSESESISYIEYSDGSVYLLDYYIIPEYFYVDSSSDSATSTLYTCQINISCNFNSGAYGHITDLKYIISYSGFDQITDVGTPMKGDFNRLEPNTNSNILVETATSDAHISYFMNIDCDDSTTPLDFTLHIYVGDDRRRIRRVT